MEKSIRLTADIGAVVSAAAAHRVELTGIFAPLAESSLVGEGAARFHCARLKACGRACKPAVIRTALLVVTCKKSISGKSTTKWSFKLYSDAVSSDVNIIRCQ